MSDLIPDEELRKFLAAEGFNPDRVGNWDKSSMIGMAQHAFLAGWAARRVSPVTREALTGEAARSDSIPALIAWNHKRSIMYSDQASAAWRAGIYGDEHPRALERLSAQHSATADALKSLSVSPPAEVTALNPSVVLAALDQMLAPWSLHRGAELSALKVKIRRLREQVAQWVPVSPESEEKK